MSYGAGKKGMSDETHIITEHIHSASMVYPTLAAGVAVAGGAGAWALSANFVEVIPASAITSPFDIHFINLENASAADTYELVLYAVTTEIGRIRFTVKDIANARILPSFPFLMVIVDKNTQIQAKLASSSGGDTATLSVFYHIY